jgi:hypothetical protein
MFLRNQQNTTLIAKNIASFLCETVHLCNYYTVNLSSHCFAAFPRYVLLYHQRSHSSQGPVWWVSMWHKNNERLDEKVGMLHCSVGEQWQDVVLLHLRSHCSRGRVWWVSMRNKNNEKLDEKVGMLHCFFAEHCQDVVLLHPRSHCYQGTVWSMSM